MPSRVGYKQDWPKISIRFRLTACVLFDIKVSLLLSYLIFLLQYEMSVGVINA